VGVSKNDFSPKRDKRNSTFTQHTFESSRQESEEQVHIKRDERGTRFEVNVSVSRKSA
jgi:hypothetical protein